MSGVSDFKMPRAPTDTDVEEIMDKVKQYVLLFQCDGGLVTELRTMIEPTTFLSLSHQERHQIANFVYEMKYNDAPYQKKWRALCKPVMKFDGEGYSEYSAYVQRSLTSQGVWHVVEATPPDNPEEMPEQWRKENKAALRTVISALNFQHKMILKNFRSSASQAWRRLEELYMPKNALSKALLLHELGNYRMEPYGEIIKYNAGFIALKAKLVDYGLIVRDAILLKVYIVGLNDINGFLRSQLILQNFNSLEEVMERTNQVSTRPPMSL